MNESTHAQTLAQSGIQVSAEQPFSLVDAGLVAAVVIAAFIYLYFKLWRNRGACSSCSNKKGSCQSQPSASTGCAQQIEIVELKAEPKSEPGLQSSAQ